MSRLATEHAGQGTATLDRASLEQWMDEHRNELTGYCYRMLGSIFDAEDAVQEAMVRAWRGLDGYEGRAAVRSWMYRIATNVCLDMLQARKRRAMPMDFSSSPWQPVEASLTPRLAESTFVEPAPDDRVLPTSGDPAELAIVRESVRLAFVAALQNLPPRQRAVLILREVLRWKAEEVAALLDTSVASVNSALQRARATMSSLALSDTDASDTLDDERSNLLSRYVDAFERYDMESLISLLHEDATQSMPPFKMWLRGSDDIVAWMVGPGHACRGSKLAPVDVNGTRGFAQWKPSPDGGLEAWAIHVIDIKGGKIAGLTFCLDTNLFATFGLPTHLES
jgi:RNA polymerase sigma-70 factor (ECF subfamily)